MKALVLEALHEPLLWKDIETPRETPGYKLVRISTAALNHRDVWITKGQYARIQLPVVPGSDGAGTCAGREVIICPTLGWGDNPAVQSRDFAILGMPSKGTFAEYTLVPEENLFDKPVHLSMEEAAALPLAGLTAYRTLFTRCHPQPGDKVLISGIGGGVALFAFQFALAYGCEVYVSSGSEEKRQRAIDLGAAGAVDYTDPDLDKAIRDVSGGGVDIVIDGAAGNGLGKLVQACNPGARIGIYGGTGGRIDGLNPQSIFWKQISIHGSTMGTVAEFGDMLRFVAAHRIHPVIDKVWAMRDGQQAVEHMAAGRQFGKLVLRND